MNPRVDYFRKQIGRKEWLFPYPLMDWLGTQVVEVEEGFLKMQFKVADHMLNPTGILHGGVAAVMLDELMGAVSFTLNRPNAFVTLNMNVDFLASAKAGDVIVGEGRVTRPGKTVLHTEAKLFAADGKLLSKATSNLIATAIPIKM